MGVPRVQPVRRTTTGDTADRNGSTQCACAASVTSTALYSGTSFIYVFLTLTKL